MNRLQNTNTVYLANPDTGELRQLFQDKDDTWVEVNRNLRWIEDGRRVLFTSERDGWRHLYAVSRTGDARRITNEPFDVVSVTAVDEADGVVYFMASSENATQRYLYRARLDGSKTERVTPADEPGRTRIIFRPMAGGRSTPSRGSTRRGIPTWSVFQTIKLSGC